MNNEKQYLAFNQIIEHYKSQIILQKNLIFKPFFNKAYPVTYCLLVKKTWGMCNSYIQAFYDEENFKKYLPKVSAQ